MFNVLLANICYIVLIWSYNAATFRKRVVCIHAKQFVRGKIVHLKAPIAAQCRPTHRFCPKLRGVSADIIIVRQLVDLQISQLCQNIIKAIVVQAPFDNALNCISDRTPHCADAKVGKASWLLRGARLALHCVFLFDSACQVCTLAKGVPKEVTNNNLAPRRSIFGRIFWAPAPCQLLFLVIPCVRPSYLHLSFYTQSI